MLTQEESAAFMDRLLEEGIKPHSMRIAEIVSDGNVACVLWEPRPLVQDAARALGWDGESSVFALPDAVRSGLAKTLGDMGDKVAAQWLNARDKHRIYVMAHGGVLLVNWKSGEGYSVELGSVDRYWLS